MTPAVVTKPAAKPAPGKAVVVQSNTAAKKVLAAPKINFVGKLVYLENEYFMENQIFFFQTS